jgi:hypothetical protein
MFVLWRYDILWNRQEIRYLRIKTNVAVLFGEFIISILWNEQKNMWLHAPFREGGWLAQLPSFGE